jgi:signal transduction histidine kinase
MKPLSTLRARFALGTGGLLLIALSAFGAYVYASMARRLAHAVDASLELVAAQVVSGLEFVEDHPVFPEPFSDEPENVDLRQRGFTAWVFSSGGELLAAFGRYQSLALPHGALPPQPEFATLEDAEPSGSIRLYSVPVSSGMSRVGVVRVARSLEEVSGTLEQLRTTLVVAVPVLAAMAGLGGYHLAARALAPIDRIARTAQRISGENLSARIGLPHSDDEVGRLAGTFDAMLGRIEQSFLRERQFSADASHELRTPLSAIQAILSTVRERRRTPSEYEQAMADLSVEAGRLERTANGLLRLASLDSSGPLSAEPVDLSTLLHDVTSSFAPSAADRGLTLACSAPPGLTVCGRSDDLIRLFSNLVDNALKFTHVGGVDIRASASAHGEIVVTIADTGIGIPGEQIPRVFDRFYRADRSRASPGAGLGLAIALGIARAHGGTIEVRSVDKKGSEFRVSLPGLSE